MAYQLKDVATAIELCKEAAGSTRAKLKANALEFLFSMALDSGDLVAAWPYLDQADESAAAQGSDARLEVTLQPYNAWANRGDGAMRVFIPVA